MLEIAERNEDRLTVVARGVLSHDDYVRLLPQLEHAIEVCGKLRLLVKLEDFRGWEPAALMDDLRFDFQHRHDFDRIAIVGSGKVQALGTQLSRALFSGEVRFFEDAAEARQWLELTSS